MIQPEFSGPIPGENYTADTKNYPWHRPPEYTDIDEAISYMMDRLTERDPLFRFLALMEVGVSVVACADIFLTWGMMDGRWTPDFALLMAGPTTRYLEIVAKVHEVEYDLGIEDNTPIPTAAYLKELISLAEGAPEEASQEPQEAPEPVPAATPAQGIMAPSPEPSGAAEEDEQMAMLGYGADEEPPTPDVIDEETA